MLNKNTYKEEGNENKAIIDAKNIDTPKEKSYISEKKISLEIEYNQVSGFLIPKNFINGFRSEYYCKSSDF